MDAACKQQVAAALNGVQDDAKLCNAVFSLIVRQRTGNAVRWAMDSKSCGADAFELRVHAAGAMDGVVSSDAVDRVARCSDRVHSVRVCARRGWIVVRCMRAAAGAGAAAAAAYTAPAASAASRRRTEACVLADVDWDASGVTEAGDRRKLARVYAAVHNMAEMMPQLHAWLELVSFAGRTLCASAVRDEDDDDDASASRTEVATHQAATAGYALAFSGMPDEVRGEFLRALCRDADLVHAYVWCTAPSRVGGGAAVLVAVLRRELSAAAESTMDALRRHRVRGAGGGGGGKRKAAG